jgi:hypothetical protein
MLITVDRVGSVGSLTEALEDVSAQPGVQAIMLLAAGAGDLSPAGLEEALAGCPCPVLGGVFPGVVAGTEVLSAGAVLWGMTQSACVITVERLSDPATPVEDLIAQAFEQASLRNRTLFVFMDSTSTGIPRLVNALFDTLGLMPNYVGGGAGSLSFAPEPCIISNRGLLVDAAVLALVETPSGLGVAHGWIPITDAFKVTESRQNEVVSLDWRPAFEVYAQAVEEHSRLRFADVPFFELSRAYPLGIARLDAEMIVRDPVIQRGGSMICVGEVPQGSFVHIVHGDSDSVIAGARQARNMAETSYPCGDHRHAVFLIDCISRVLFLGPDFEHELAALQDGSPLFGALTLGEIANTGRAFLDFYNKTVVVAMLAD